jgi:hypothetical protein
MPLRQFFSRKQGVFTANRENHQAQFYKDYRRAAEEYDKEFLRKYNEDLNTTLIFVSTARGLLELTNWGIRPVCFPFSLPHSFSQSVPNYSLT